MKLTAQECIADYFITSYQGANGQTISDAVMNNKNETLLAGDAPVYNSSQSKGFVAKLTPQGSVLWSKNIICPGYTNVSIKTAMPLSDGSVILMGNAANVDSISHNLYKEWGIVCKTDAYGKLLWTKGFSNYNELANATVLQNIVKISDDDFILFGTLYGRQAPYYIVRGPQILMRMDAAGNIKWKTTMSSETGFVISNYGVYADRLGFTTVNGGKNIVFGFSLSQHILEGFGYGDFIQQGYYLLNIDFATGQRVWDKVYTFPSQQTISGTSYGGIEHVAELPGGGLSFAFSFSNYEVFTSPPYNERSAVMITASDGTLKTVTDYYNTVPGCYTTDAMNNGTNGEQLMLLNDGKQPILMQTDATGNIQWQKGYGNLGGFYTPVSLQKTTEGYYIFAQGYANSLLIKTDANADIDCAISPVNMITGDVTNLFKPAVTDLRFQYATEVLPYFVTFTSDYPLQSNSLCYKACCRDTLDVANTKQITICEGDVYIMPNQYIVRDSGTYYINYKTAKGCDSVSFYHVNVLKKPDTLDISSAEICLDEKDSIIITATPGYDMYNWMGTTTAGNTYTATTGGTYYVSVSGTCGSLTSDSIVIYDKCNYSISMPSAFTPNGDGLNDIFRIPPAIQATIKRFVIYNRWGYRIFETADKGKGWDGTFNGRLQPFGTYVYIIETQSPDGKTTKVQGVVTLLR